MGKVFVNTKYAMSSAAVGQPGRSPDGKGMNSFLGDWHATEPRGIAAKPPRQIMAELFTSMLVLSAQFKYRPAPGSSNYLYWIDDCWTLSLIAPGEWSQQRREGFVGICTLQRDMTWTITPSEGLVESSPVSAAVRRFFSAFAGMMDTTLTLEEVLPFYAGKLAYYQRLYAAALSRSVSKTLGRSRQTSISCCDWRIQLSHLDNELLARSGLDPSSGIWREG